MIDEEDWSAMDVDVKGAAFEGLLEKAASEGKKGAGQYFTPRPLIQAIVSVMKPDPRGKQGFTICDPACGTGGFLVCSHEWLEVDRGFHGYHGYFFFSYPCHPRNPWFHRFGLMNLFLHGVEPHIYLGDAIYEPDRGERYDVVLTNPPFGTKGANQAPDRDDFTIETSKCLRTATRAQLRPARHDHAQARRTRRDGAAGQAGSPAPPFEGKAGEVFELLMQDCALHTVLRLPRGTFTPSLLARAFAGKLVPQDPNDEPASKLLERLSRSRTW